MNVSIENISQSATDRQALLLPTIMTSHMGYRLAHLDLTFVRSQGQGQGQGQGKGNTHFDGEYF